MNTNLRGLTCPGSIAHRRGIRCPSIATLRGCVCLLLALVVQASAQNPLDDPPPTYIGYRVTSPIVIDGELNEAHWKHTPRMDFAGLVDGAPAWFDSYSQMVWDDTYLYVGFWAADPNVFGTVGPDTPEPRDFWKDNDKYIMLHDPLFMVFVDPDGDHRNYIEMHINALNNVDDIWLNQGSTEKDRQVLDLHAPNYHLEWDCPGVEHAIAVYGTLNDPSDTDRGWSAEIAIPWTALEPLTEGSLPPAEGDQMLVHSGWEYRLAVNEPVIYWTWPVIGILDDHQLWRYGRFVISADAPGSRSFPTPSQNE